MIFFAQWLSHSILFLVNILNKVVLRTCAKSLHAMTENPKQTVTKLRDVGGNILQQYANAKRTAGLFNDVTVQAEGESIPANRLVLACYSKFFESMFLSRMKEQYQSEVEIHQFDGKIVKSLIDFMYCGKIDIDSDNVMDLITVADFLQMEDVKQFCFEFLEASLTIDNCIEIVKASTMYHNASGVKTTYDFISENFDELAQTDAIKNLSKDALITLIDKIDLSKFQHSSVYKAIINWTQHDENRKVDFVQLFLKLDLQLLSWDFLEEVAQEPLVKCNLECVSAIMTNVFTKRKHGDSKSPSKILCVNGLNPKSVFEVYSITGDTGKVYPQVPHKPQNHNLLKLNDFVYAVGGCVERSKSTDKVYELNLSETKMQWKEVASMAKARFDFGAAVFDGKLVVNGTSNCPATESYDVKTNEWNEIAPTTRQKCCNALVAAEGALFAIGGYNLLDNSSVERLDDLHGQWKEVQPMNIPRHSFAAVFCKGFVYVVGGYSTEVENSVERYDPSGNVWTNVSSMNVERQKHAACVLQDKIYVIGGKNVTETVVKSIECYDPDLDRWEIVGETKEDCCYHAVVPV